MPFFLKRLFGVLVLVAFGDVCNKLMFMHWCQCAYVEELVREETHGNSEPDGQETQSCFCCITIGLSCIKQGGIRVLQMG